MNIKIVGTNSSNKIKLIKNVKKSLSTLKLDFTPTILNVITDKNYNVKNPPLLVINDNVISAGKVLTEREISKYIKEYENNNHQKTVDGAESYYKLLNYFEEFLEEYTLTTSKDKTFKEFLNN